jgi:hypothetical protein
VSVAKLRFWLVEEARNLKRLREEVVAVIPFTVTVMRPEEAVKEEELTREVEEAIPLTRE